jgi:hypothetical protein
MTLICMPSATSHTQPDPNWAAPARSNVALKASNDEKPERIA